MKADNVIRLESGPGGGRLKYFRDAPTDAEQWDQLWDDEVGALDYTSRLEGEMPRHLEAVFTRWAPPSGRVLEAGCGLAGFTVAAHARGYQAEGVDYAPRVIEMLQQRFPQIRFWRGDVLNLVSVPDDSYDVVYSPGVCEHYEEGPEAVLREARRVTKVGGIIIVSAPCFNSFRRIIARLGAFRGPEEGYFYQYAFSPRDLSERLSQIGCNVLQTRQYGTMKTLYDHLPFVPKLSSETFHRLSNNALGTKPSHIARRVDSMPILRTWGHSGIWVARKV